MRLYEYYPKQLGNVLSWWRESSKTQTGELRANLRWRWRHCMYVHLDSRRRFDSYRFAAMHRIARARNVTSYERGQHGCRHEKIKQGRNVEVSEWQRRNHVP